MILIAALLIGNQMIETRQREAAAQKARLDSEVSLVATHSFVARLFPEKCASSEDGNTLYAAANDRDGRVVKAFDVSTGRLSIVAQLDGNGPFSVDTVPGHPNLLIVGSLQGDTHGSWSFISIDVQNGHRGSFDCGIERGMDGGCSAAFAISSDGNYVALGVDFSRWCEDHIRVPRGVGIFDTTTGARLYRFAIPSARYSYSCLGMDAKHVKEGNSVEAVETLTEMKWQDDGTLLFMLSDPDRQGSILRSLGRNGEATEWHSEEVAATTTWFKAVPRVQNAFASSVLLRHGVGGDDVEVVDAEIFQGPERSTTAVIEIKGGFLVVTATLNPDRSSDVSVKKYLWKSSAK